MLDFSGSFSQVSLTNTNIFFQGVNACSTSFSRYERGRLKNKLCCSRCVQHITEIEFHWYSPGRRTLHPRSIYSLTSTCNWLRGPSPLLMKAAEKVRNEGADDFPIPSPHLPSFSLYSTCVFPLSEFALCRSLFFPPRLSVPLFSGLQVLGLVRQNAEAAARRCITGKTLGV